MGVIKEYNNFELQKALTQKNVLKANKIISYFGKNPSDNPLVVTVTSLYFFFSKIFLYHFLKDKSKGNVAAKLGINPFFVSDYTRAAKIYPIEKTVKVISLLREYDLKSKGVNNTSTPDSELLKELIFKILH